MSAGLIFACTVLAELVLYLIGLIVGFDRKED